MTTKTEPTENNQIKFLTKLHKGVQMLSDAANEYLQTLATPEAKENKPTSPATDQETTFSILKFEQQTGAKIGEYEVTNKASNSEDKWTQAYNVLRNSNATIKNRYHGEGYVFSYWLYRVDKIYRQRLKPKTC